MNRKPTRRSALSTPMAAIGVEVNVFEGNPYISLILPPLGDRFTPSLSVGEARRFAQGILAICDEIEAAPPRERKAT